MTGPEAIQEIIAVHPSLGEMFPHPESYRSFKGDLFDSASKALTERILYLFEINETEVILKYFPLKGWQAGAEFSCGIEGALGEVSLGNAEDFACSPGFALLGLLWSCVVNGGYRPYYESHRARAWKQRRLMQHNKASP